MNTPLNPDALRAAGRALYEHVKSQQMDGHPWHEWEELGKGQDIACDEAEAAITAYLEAAQHELPASSKPKPNEQRTRPNPTIDMETPTLEQIESVLKVANDHPTKLRVYRAYPVRWEYFCSPCGILGNGATPPPTLEQQREMRAKHLLHEILIAKF